MNPRVLLSRSFYWLLLVLWGGGTLAPAAALSLVEQPAPGTFNWVTAEGVADVLIATNDFKVVQIAADCLAADVERVTGRKPAVKSIANSSAAPSHPVILVGTLGQNVLLDGLVKAGKLDAQRISGRWESYLVTTVANPWPGVDLALVVAGSDRRGTAYGCFTLSEMIGVSPWYWWDDVPPAHQSQLILSPGEICAGSPTVKYRGIFINDEDWSLQPWAAHTFEPETGDIGPKTYAKVCELLLRLKANYLWPAMHPCTHAFNHYPTDRLVADDYAIVMGSSHCEQMLRDNVDEFDVKTRGPWDYELNRTNILEYWRERLAENGRFENVYTIGMRGIHDGAMPGGGTLAEKTARLQRVIGDQRKLISTLINPEPSRVPQIFCPYKEVLTLYQNGLQVPDDVTLVWPDDNYGYIRQLSTPAEQRRAGGAGLYYHVSYWGAPADYLWLCTTPPSLMWEELRKVCDWQARQVWVLNVGGLKKSEILLDCFARLAWDFPGATPPGSSLCGVPVAFDQREMLRQFAAREFGPASAGAVADVLDEYYRLNLVKPEALHSEPARFSFDNDQEASDRLARFAQLMAKTEALADKMEPRLKDAFYELILFPVRASALRNGQLLRARHYQELLPTEPQSAEVEAMQARRAFAAIDQEVAHYNHEVAGGKWNRIVPVNPRQFKPWKDAGVPPGAVATAAPAYASPRLEPTPGAKVSWTESSGVVSIPADAPSRVINRGTNTWQIVAGLGRSRLHQAITVLPATQPSVASQQITTLAPELVYDFQSGPPTGVKSEIWVYALPTQPVNARQGMRYAVALDDGAPQVVNLASSEKSAAWNTNVLRSAAIGVTPLGTWSAGPQHSVHLWALDPGLVLEKIVVNLGGFRPTVQGPPFTMGVMSVK